jgi:hypothetical protein
MRAFKALWKKFRADRPGERFQNLYHRRCGQKAGRSPAQCAICAVGGIGLVLVGLILVPAPGPGWLIVAIGCGVLASEFLVFARGCDAVEVKVRTWLAAWRSPKTPRPPTESTRPRIEAGS